MQRKFAFLTALILILALAFTAFAEEAAIEPDTDTQASAEEGTVMYVGTLGGLKIREAPDLKAPVIMSVMVNRTVNVLSIDGKWAKVRFDWTEYDTVVEGYMWAGYLSSKPIKVPKKQKSYTIWLIPVPIDPIYPIDPIFPIDPIRPIDPPYDPRLPHIMHN